jgi:hypothetical protein
MLSPYVREARAEDVPALLPLMRELARFEDYLEDFAVDEEQLTARAFTLNPSAGYSWQRLRAACSAMR